MILLLTARIQSESDHEVHAPVQLPHKHKVVRLPRETGVRPSNGRNLLCFNLSARMEESVPTLVHSGVARNKINRSSSDSTAPHSQTSRFQASPPPWPPFPNCHRPL